MADLNTILSSLGEAMANVGNYSAEAAAQANAVSRQAQSAQAAFNYDAMNTANSITDNRIASQYAYNSGMMAAANEYNTGMWQRAADFNSEMWEKQAEFNRIEAEKQRAWQTQMANTQYQRAVKDMEKAGLNPILAVNGGGVGTSVPSGSTASVGGASMSSAQSAQASGGLVGAESASINNYSGQMEYLAGTLGLLGAFFSNLSSAEKVGQEVGEAVEAGSEALDKASGGKLTKVYEDTEKVQNGDMSFLQYAIDNRPGSVAMGLLEQLLGGSKKK